MRSFVKINPSQNGEIALLFTDLGKSGPLSLFAKMKFSRNFRIYSNNEHRKRFTHDCDNFLIHQLKRMILVNNSQDLGGSKRRLTCISTQQVLSTGIILCPEYIMSLNQKKNKDI